MSAGAPLVLAAIGELGNYTEDGYDPRAAAALCDDIARAARRLAVHYRTTAISKHAAAALMARGRAEYAEILAARQKEHA